MADSLTEDENVMSMFDMDPVSSLLPTDYLYLVRGTGALRDKYTTALAILNYICSNAHTMDYIELTHTGSNPYALKVEGATYLKGGTIASGSVFDIMSTSILLRGATSVSSKLTVNDTTSTYALEVTGAAKFNNAVTFAGALGVGSVNVNAHQAGSGDGFSVTMTSNGLNVKDDGNVSVLRVSAEEAITGETSRMDVVARVCFDGNVTFESGVRFYGNVNMSGNVDIGSPTSKKTFNVNGNDFYMDTNGTAHVVDLEATLLTASKAEVGRLSTNFSRVTANVNLNTTYSTLKQKERIVIYNDSSSDIVATLDSTGNHTTVLRQCCMEFICVAYDSTHGPTWRPIEGYAPIN